MINIKQMTLSVAEYSSKFEEARLRCSEFHVEDQFAVYTRFVNGLRFDIQRMVKLHAPHTIEDALSREVEKALLFCTHRSVQVIVHVIKR